TEANALSPELRAPGRNAVYWLATALKPNEIVLARSADLVRRIRRRTLYPLSYGRRGETQCTGSPRRPSRTRSSLYPLSYGPRGGRSVSAVELTARIGTLEL